MDALLNAVTNKLITTLADNPFSLGEESIGIMPDGMPPANCGQTYVAIYGSGWEPAIVDSNRSLDEYFGVVCCISKKTGVYPKDRTGVKAYATIVGGMCKLAYKIMSVIDKQTDILISANDDDDNGGEYIEYLRWLGTDPNPIPQPPAWFSSEDVRIPTAGYIMQVRFGLARRKIATTALGDYEA